MAAWPSTVTPVSAKIGSFQPTRISVAQSLKRQVRSIGAQRFTLQLSYRHLTTAQMAVFWAFLQTLRGQYNTCTFTFPSGAIFAAALGSWATSGTIRVNGASQTGRTINLKNFTAGQTGVVKAGDLIKFSDTKVYQASADANSDGSGNAAVSIEPALIVSPADNEAVTYNAVPLTLQLVSDNAEFNAMPAVLHDFDVSFIEAY